MWKTYRDVIHKYPRISLQEERRLIRAAKRGGKAQAEELVLRHIGFVIFRIHKRAFPAYARRFGEDLLSQGIFLLYDKIHSYNLRYYDENGIFKPVRFVSYVWKAVDGLILASLRKELRHEKGRLTGYREGEEYDIFERIPGKNDPCMAAALQRAFDA
jgi:DNA-directed RNA polymerase specialized sigma subunit